MEYTVYEGDTIFINTKYYDGKKIKRNVTERFPKGYYWADYEEEIILINNFIVKKTLETTSKTVDTNFIKKVIYNKLCKTKKTYTYNAYKREWFVSEKLKSSKYEIKRFYHDYHKMYFSEKTKFKYNKYGDRVLEVTREYPGRYLRKKVIRIYKYHNEK